MQTQIQASEHDHEYLLGC